VSDPSAGAGRLSVGIDAVDVDRFRELIARRPEVRNRLFTEPERRLAGGYADPAPRLAARFAAKEATMKALGAGLGAFRFQDVEVLRDDSGAPVLRVRGGAAELARNRQVESWRVSLTHTRLVAQAIVVALGCE
jgi:holo-[acyl-carrier protein] synthase